MLMNRVFLWGVLSLLCVGNVYLFGALRAPPVLKISYLNVGDGDAVLVQTPAGKTVLIDAGPDASILRGLGMTLPFWKRHLGALIISHFGADALSGIPPLLSRYKIGALYAPTLDNDSKTWAQIQNAASTTPMRTLKRGDRIDLGSGVFLDALFPFSESDSLVFKMSYGHTAFLFMGDIGESERKELETLDGEDDALTANVLLVPHEGKDGVIDKAWLNAVHPIAAVLSVSPANRYAYPATSALEIIQDSGIKLLRTDEKGTITFVSDGVMVTQK